MQPEPSAVSPTEPTERSTPKHPHIPAQYGLRENDDTAISLSSADDGAATETTATPAERLAADAAFAASLQELGDGRAEVSRRLSPLSTPSPPAGRNRITEYEKTSTPPIKKREGPGFEVIKKYRSPSDKRSPVQELPNGALYTLRVEDRPS